MPCTAVPLTRQQLAHAFGLRLAHAMQERGWQPIPSVLVKHFNQMHPGKPVTIYSARSWLMGEFLPRPQRLISLALCLGVPPIGCCTDSFMTPRPRWNTRTPWF